MNNLMDKKVDEIMTQIGTDILGIGFEDSEEKTCFEQIGFSSIDAAEISRCIDYMNQNWELRFYFDLGTGIKGKIKKVIRKFLVFIGVPIVEQQSYYNANIIQVLNQVKRYIYENEQRIIEQNERIEKLENMLNTLV